MCSFLSFLFCIIKKRKKRRIFLLVFFFFFFFSLLCLQTFSEGEESAYYYYYSFPVSCWLSGPFFHWLIARKSRHRQTFFSSPSLSSKQPSDEHEERKRRFFFAFVVHEPSCSIWKKLMIEVNLTRDDYVYPSNGFEPLCIHIESG